MLEDKHDCPTNTVFSDKKGKCIPKSDAETVDTNSSVRNQSASNLKFPKVKLISGTSEVIDMKSNIDTSDSLGSNSDQLQKKVQQVNQRAPQAVQDREVVGIKTKQFKRQDLGHGSTNL